MDFFTRRSIRLKGYDYSGEGAYFLTLCIYNRTCLFGRIEDAAMVPTEVLITRATSRSPLQNGTLKGSLGSFVAGFKAAAAKRINAACGRTGGHVWQRAAQPP